MGGNLETQLELNLMFLTINTNIILRGKLLQ